MTKPRPTKRAGTTNPLEDGRQWCIVFEGDDSAVRSINAAMALRMHGIEKFMMHEWKPKPIVSRRRK